MTTTLQTAATTTLAVVITSYNYRDYVVEAVASALQQTRAPKQIIVVDDGSTDGSQAHLSARYGHEPQVTLVFTENGGQLAAFQRGIALADADVVCFLDADDRWAPTHLELVGALYDARPDIDFVFNDIELFGQESRSIRYAKRAQDLGFTAIGTWALTFWYGAPTSALSLRLGLARRCVDLPAHVTAAWRLSADNCLVYGASILGGRKYFLPTGTVGYRIHGKNGWWSKRGPNEAYHIRLRSRALIAEYARIAGIDQSCLELTKLEYKTKPAPDWAETRRYAKLCMHGDAPLWKRLERALSVLIGRRKRRR